MFELSLNAFAQVLGLCSEHLGLRLRRQPTEKLAGTSVEGDYEMSITKKREIPVCFYFLLRQKRKQKDKNILS